MWEMGRVQNRRSLMAPVENMSTGKTMVEITLQKQVCAVRGRFSTAQLCGIIYVPVKIDKERTR